MIKCLVVLCVLAQIGQHTDIEPIITNEFIKYCQQSTADIAKLMKMKVVQQKKANRYALARKEPAAIEQDKHNKRLEQQVDLMTKKRLLIAPSFGSLPGDIKGINLMLGQVGTLGTMNRATVLQVLDPKNMLVVIYHPIRKTERVIVWVEDVPTAEYKDDDNIMVINTLYVANKKQYTNTGGASQTVAVLKPIHISTQKYEFYSNDIDLLRKKE